MMGERMRGRLLDAGPELAVDGRTRAHRRSRGRGAAVADTPRAAAEGAESLIAMHADAAAERATAHGETGFLAAAGEPLWVDM